MSLRDWTDINKNHTTSSVGPLQTSSTKRWGPKNTPHKCGEFYVEAQTFRTGGVPKISIYGDLSCDISTNGYISRLFTYREPIEKRLGWLYEYRNTFLQEVDVDDIELCYEQIDSLVTLTKYNELDEMIKILSNWKVSFEIQSGILRYMASSIDFLPSWKYALRVLVDDMSENDLDCKEILLGLL